MPKCTGNYDKDILASPKIPKSKSGQKVKTSVTAGTLKVKTNIPTEDRNETDNSEVFVPCSGTVSSNNKSIIVTNDNFI